MDNNTNIPAERQPIFTCTCENLKIFAAGDKKSRTFTGVAYGGGIIYDHGWWDKVAFDLSQIKFQDKMPVLLSHDTEKIVGYTTSVKIKKNIEVEGILSDLSDYGHLVADHADEGFPWQLSIFLSSNEIEYVAEEIDVLLNGQVLKGPLHIFRHGYIREVSFCPIGADRETSVNVFNATIPSKETNMDKEKVTPSPGPSLERDLAITSLSEDRAKFAAENADLKTERSKFAADNAELRGQLKSFELENRNLKESLTSARNELETVKNKMAEFTQSSRAALLAADYQKLGLEFKAEDESVKALLNADDAVFNAYRKSLDSITVKSPMAPPAGAFISQTIPVARDGADASFTAPPKSIAERAKEFGRKEGSLNA
jgi:hypothetical protein